MARSVLILCACAGAAVFYYAPILGKPMLVIAALLLGLALVARKKYPVQAIPGKGRFFALAPLCLCSFVLGSLLGFHARSSIQDFRPGLSESTITGLWGVLVEDPRTLYDGRGMGYLLVSKASGRIPGASADVEASAQGRVLAFFPESVMPRLYAFGRQCHVYIEGTPAWLIGNSRSPDAFIFQVRGVHILKPAPLLEQFRSALRAALRAELAPYRWGGLGLALLFGIRDHLDAELSNAYRLAGCSHVLALSGMHLGIISGFIAFLLKKPLGIRLAGLLGGIVILCYAFLVGLQPSLLRSLIMYLLSLVILLGNLPRNIISILGLSFLIQLVLDPSSGTTLSFILSYAALTGICFLSQPIEQLLSGALPTIILKPLAASLGAFLATASICAWYFGSIQPIGILLGIAIIPLTTAFMIAVIIALPLLPILPAAGPIGTICSLLYDVMAWLVARGSTVPAINISSPLPLCISAPFLWFMVIWGAAKYGSYRKSIAPFGTN